MDHRLCVGTDHAAALHHEIVPYVTSVLACADGQDFVLEPGVTPSKDKVRAALASALRHAVRGSVAFMPKKAFIERARSPSPRRLVTTLSAALEPAYEFTLLVRLGSARRARLRKHFAYEGVRPFATVIDPHPMYPVFDAVRAVLYHVFGAALSDDRAAVERLKPLMSLLSWAVPVGTTGKKNGSADWLVVVS